MSVALTLFHDLCAVGTALAQVRDTFVPACNEWAALTCIILSLDNVIDRLVRSSGLEQDEEDRKQDARMSTAESECRWLILEAYARWLAGPTD